MPRNGGISTAESLFINENILNSQIVKDPKQRSGEYSCTRAYGLGSQRRPNECIFGSGKPRGVGILGGRVYEPGEGMGMLVYEQPGNEVDGSCHSKEGSK
jgi:hypothetical protein